jgi:NAD(P)-dependent dehydrogenase (short-subunit alcohol dehydrogenase family)
MTDSELTRELKRRGIYEPAQIMAWRESGNGWVYPVKNAAGVPVMHNEQILKRFKGKPDHNPKYAWIPEKPDNVHYYYAPGVKGGMGGKLWYASGEPDVLTLMAAGHNNSFCTMHTELLIPENFLELLEWLEIETLLHAPDLDDTGIAAARKLKRLMLDSPIHLHLIKLPGERVPSHGPDLNSTWIDLEFDRNAFNLETIEQLELAPEPINEPFRPSHRPDVPTDSELPPKFLGKIVQAIEARTGITLQFGSGGWSQNFRCVTGKHDDKHASAGWNAKGAYNCFACGTMNAKQTGEMLGIRLADYIEREPIKIINVPKAQLSKVPIDNGSRVAIARAVLEQLPDKSKLFHDGNDMSDYLAFMAGERGMFGKPFRFPFKSMHHIGGFCETMMTGKITLVVGASGSCKTMLIESASDLFCEQGVNNIVISDEWGEDEMKARRIGRNIVNGSKFRYIDALSLAVNGGKAAPEIIKDAKLTVEKLKALPGQVKYYENKRGDGLPMYMEDILNGATEFILEQRKDGVDYPVLIWDYVQAYPLKQMLPGSSNVEEQKLRLLQTWAKMMKVNVWSVTQVTKAAAARMRGQGDYRRSGGWLSKTDMQYLREDTGQVILIWQPALLTIQEKRIQSTPAEWDEIIKFGGDKGDDDWIYHNRVGEPEFRGDAVLFPAKNSVGSTIGFGNFRLDFEKGRVVENYGKVVER